uniref:Uncharacterized protein n=1 Tax=Anguilla anguilla TaxID=7936 RepID=A0A0E9QBJ6_ANGAN
MKRIMVWMFRRRKNQSDKYCR